MITERPLWEEFPRNIQDRLEIVEWTIDLGGGTAKLDVPDSLNPSNIMFAYLWMKDISKIEEINALYKAIFKNTFELPARCIGEYSKLECDARIEAIALGSKKNELGHINSNNPSCMEGVREWQQNNYLPKELGPYSLATVAPVKIHSEDGAVTHYIATTAFEVGTSASSTDEKKQAECVFEYLDTILEFGNITSPCKTTLSKVEVIASKKKYSGNKIHNVLRAIHAESQKRYGTPIAHAAPRLVDRLPEDIGWGLIGIGGSTVIEKPYLSFAEL